MQNHLLSFAEGRFRMRHLGTYFSVIFLDWCVNGCPKKTQKTKAENLQSWLPVQPEHTNKLKHPNRSHIPKRMPCSQAGCLQGSSMHRRWGGGEADHCSRYCGRSHWFQWELYGQVLLNELPMGMTCRLLSMPSEETDAVSRLQTLFAHNIGLWIIIKEEPTGST